MNNVVRILIPLFSLLCSPAVFATLVVVPGTTTLNNFTLYGTNGLPVGGANDLKIGFDGTWSTSISGTPSGTVISQSTLFYSGTTSSDPVFTGVEFFKPGSYAVPSNLCDVGPLPNSCPFPFPTVLTVGPGEVGIHLTLDWFGYENTDIIGVLLDPAPVQGAVWTGGPGTYTGPLYDLVALDSDADGVPGWRINEGPLAGQSFALNFNVPASVVPVPAAIWLFGSGLLGLVGMAGRKKA